MPDSVHFCNIPVFSEKEKISTVFTTSYTGLCVTVQLYSLPAWLTVTVQLYSLPAWLAGAVNNNNREFVVCGVVVVLCVRM